MFLQNFSVDRINFNSSVVAVAETLRNLGGRIVGDTVSLGATGDLTVEGGEIAAKDGLTVQAGHDLKIASTTRTQPNDHGFRGRRS